MLQPVVHAIAYVSNNQLLMLNVFRPSNNRYQTTSNGASGNTGSSGSYGSTGTSSSTNSGAYGATGSDTPGQNQVTLKCWNCKNMLTFEDCEKYGFEETCMPNQVNQKIIKPKC